MKNILLICLIMVLGALSAYGQGHSSEVYPKQASIEHNDAVKKFSRDVVSFFGRSPMFGGLQQRGMDVNQFANITTIGHENVAILSQMGNWNIGMIDIEGNNNRTTLEQRGDRLYSQLDVNGNFNRLNVRQDGTDLQNFIYLSGNGLDFGLTQTNSGLQLMQSNPGSIPLTIQHSGRSIPIIIHNQ